MLGKSLRCEDYLRCHTGDPMFREYPGDRLMRTEEKVICCVLPDGDLHQRVGVCAGHHSALSPPLRLWHWALEAISR